MPDTVAQEITLSAVGGDQVAATFNGVKDSMTSVVGAHDQMKAKFTEKFEHVGLRLFAGEMIRSQGLAGEMRPILGGVMLAINSVGASFGAAAPEIMLVAAALLAIYEVTEHVIQKHEENVKGLEKVVEGQSKEKDALDKVIDALQGTEDAGGSLTAAQQRLLAADKALSDHIKNEQITSYRALIKALQDQEDANARAAIRAHELHAVLAVGITIWNDYVSYMSKAWEFLQHLIPGYDLLHMAVTKITAAFGSHASAVHLSAAEQDKLNAKNLESEAAMAKAQAAIEALATGTKKSYEEMKKAAEDHKNAVIDAIHAEMEEREKANDKAVETTDKALAHLTQLADKYNEDIRSKDNETFLKKNQHLMDWESKQKATIDALFKKDVEYAKNHITNETQRLDEVAKLNKAHDDALVALHKDTASKLTDINTMVWDQYKKSVTAALDAGLHSMSAGISQMIVEGKSFQQEFGNIMRTLAEKFIESVIVMIIEWAALQAVMDIWPGGAAAYKGVAQAAYPAVSQAAYSNIGQQAAGGTYYADSPTLAMFGEAGPEVATFTPVSGGSSSQSSTGGDGQTQNITVGDIHINVQLESLSGSDRQTLLRQLGDEVRTASVDAVRFAVSSSNLATKNSRAAV